MNHDFIYILTNERNSVFYVGVTSDLQRRLYEHRNHTVKGFTDRYNVTKVIYIEEADNMETAIKREKQLKGWSRIKKINLIKSINPDFIDLYNEYMK